MSVVRYLVRFNGLCGSARTATANGRLPTTISEQARPIGVVCHGRIVEAATGSRPGHLLLANGDGTKNRHTEPGCGTVAHELHELGISRRL